MAKKTIAAPRDLAAFEVPEVTPQQVFDQRQVVAGMERHLNGSLPISGDIQKKLEQEQVQLIFLEDNYFSQGIKPIPDDALPEEKQMIILENKMHRLELENKVIEYGFTHGGPTDYRQYDQNTAAIRDLKKQHGAIEAEYYSDQARLAKTPLKVELKPGKDDTYKLMTVIDGTLYTATLNSQQRDKMLSLDDRHRMSYLATLMPMAPLNELSQVDRQKLSHNLTATLFHYGETASRHYGLPEDASQRANIRNTPQDLSAIAALNFDQSQGMAAENGQRVRTGLGM